MCFQANDRKRVIQAGQGAPLRCRLFMKSVYSFVVCVFLLSGREQALQKKGGGFPTKQNRKERVRLGFASARSALQEENLQIHSSSPPLHSFSCSLLYSHPSTQPKNLRAALNPLSVLRHCKMCARSPSRQPPKGVFLC